jgi:hypothetical protein
VGTVRRHPFLTLIFVLGSLPVLMLIAWQAMQYTPACRTWRHEVSEASAIRSDQPAWHDYHRGDMTWDEYYGNVRDHVAYQMRDERPAFCR